MRDRYWHNMAARIQRAWRNFIRYRIECATRIQRFWRRKKDGIEFARVRQKGHDLLGGRKERRRYSLLSYRRFAGDYLDVGGKGSGGQQLRSAAGLNSSEAVLFSCRVELLKSSFGRSSKPSPRFLIVTNSAAYFLIATAAQGSIVTSVERKIPLVTIRSVGVSNLRDDWVAFNTSASEEGDPVFTCVFKTELLTHMHTSSGGSLQILIGPTVDYAKKKDKKAVITFRKDPSNPRVETYKSHVVAVGQGEPANSVTRPMARPKPGVVRPITAGKLLRKGGPSKPHPSAGRVGQGATLPGKSSLPTASKGMSYETSASVKKAAVPAPAAAAAAGRPTPPPPPRAGGPPPPPPPARPETPKYRSLYNFDGQEGEMNLKKEDVVEVKEKDDNGWWLVVKGGKEGWAPSNYLELIPQAKPAAPPPPPPGRRAPPAAPKSAAAPTTTGGLNGSAIASAAASLRSSAANTANSSPPTSRPGSGMGGGPPVLKPKPPVLAPKPGAPPLAPKPPAGGSSTFGRAPPVPPAPPAAAAAAAGGARKPPVPKAPAAFGGGGSSGGGGVEGGTKLKLSALGGGQGKPGGGIQAMDLQAALKARTGRPVID